MTVTKENFTDTIENAGRPVLVDFWAPWCGYCRRLAPVLDAVAASFTDKLDIGKVNVDEQAELETRFDVMTLPTLLLFSKGQVVSSLVNPGSKAEIDAWLRGQGVAGD